MEVINVIVISNNNYKLKKIIGGKIIKGQFNNKSIMINFVIHETTAIHTYIIALSVMKYGRHSTVDLDCNTHCCDTATLK